MRKIASVAALFIMLTVAPLGAANASPDTGSGGAAIESADGPRDAGASIDKPGTGSPDYTKPEPEPAKGTPEHDAWEAGERARIANLEASKGIDNSPSICSTDRASANYCPVAGDE